MTCHYPITTTADCACTKVQMSGPRALKMIDINMDTTDC